MYIGIFVFKRKYLLIRRRLMEDQISALNPLTSSTYRESASGCFLADLMCPTRRSRRPISTGPSGSLFLGAAGCFFSFFGFFSSAFFGAAGAVSALEVCSATFSCLLGLSSCKSVGLATISLPFPTWAWTSFFFQPSISAFRAAFSDFRLSSSPFPIALFFWAWNYAGKYNIAWRTI